MADEVSQCMRSHRGCSTIALIACHYSAALRATRCVTTKQATHKAPKAGSTKKSAKRMGGPKMVPITGIKNVPVIALPSNVDRKAPSAARSQPLAPMRPKRTAVNDPAMMPPTNAASGKKNRRSVPPDEDRSHPATVKTNAQASADRETPIHALVSLFLKPREKNGLS